MGLCHEGLIEPSEQCMIWYTPNTHGVDVYTVFSYSVCDVLRPCMCSNISQPIGTYPTGEV